MASICDYHNQLMTVVLKDICDETLALWSCMAYNLVSFLYQREYRNATENKFCIHESKYYYKIIILITAGFYYY